MKRFYLTTALALITSPALADITPEELWQSWQQTTAELGASLTSSQHERQGNVLVIHDAKTSMDFGFFQVDQSVDIMRLEARSDGSVAVSYDSPIRGGGTVSLPDGPTSTMSITGAFSGTTGIVTGTPDNYSYDFTIGAMRMNILNEISEEAGPKMTVNGENRSTDLHGQIHFEETSAGMNISYTFSLGTVEGTQDSVSEIAAGNSAVKASQRTTAEGYTGDISLFLPKAGPSADTGGRFLREGFTLAANIGVERFSATQKTASPYVNMEIEMEQGPTTFSVNIGPQSASLSGEGEGLRMALNNPGFGPQPYSVEVANSGATMALPLYPSDTPQDARYAISLEGVTLSDSIWALLDPQNTLSRAPADFAIDARASIGLLLDWTNIDAVKAWQGPPAILHQITLQNFLIGFENARVTGAGVVDFSTGSPAPMPNGGALDFTLEGIPALLEKLGGLPMVDPGMIAGAQGMLGLFTSAGEGDTLTSKIEFGEGGAVTVNGQRMR